MATTMIPTRGLRLAALGAWLLATVVAMPARASFPAMDRDVDQAIAAAEIAAVDRAEAADEGTASFTWLRDGRLSRIQFPQGATELREYEAAGRVYRVTHSQHTALVSQVTYSYDANGNRIAQEEINGGGPEQTLYTFDLADRLTGVAYAEELVEYVLDKVGNRTGQKTFSLGGGGPPALASDKTFTLDLRHRVVSVADALDPAASESYEWDAAGNQTARIRGGVREDFFYDARNRLVEVRRDGSLLERYRYDERDRRVRKAGGGAVVRYVWDQGSVLAVEDEAGNQLERYARLGDRLLALEDGTALGAERQQYFLLDGLSTPMAIVRGDGLIQVRYRWDVWGRLRSGSGESNNRFGLSGLERDAQSELIYARTRYLDPSLGRFLQPDPWSGALERPLSLNPYLYAHGNPTIFVDPTGLCVFGLPCPEPLQIAKDTAIGVAGDVGGMVVGAVDFASGGSLSGAQDAYQAYKQSEGSLFERALVAQDAGNRARAAVLTLGYSEAKSGVEHTKELLGASSIERAGVLFGEAAVEGDWEKGLAGVGELLSGAGQIAGTVAGGAGTVSKVQAIRTARVAQQAQQATRARVLANVAESRSAREASRFKGHLDRLESRVRVEAAVGESAAARSASNARQRFKDHVTRVEEALDRPGTAPDDPGAGVAFGLTRAQRELLAAKRPCRYRCGVVEAVWRNSADATGRVFDPNTLAELYWDRLTTRAGQWDMGHLPGRSYDDLKRAFLEGLVSRKQFLDEFNNPANYRPELPGANRSRKFDRKDGGDEGP